MKVTRRRFFESILKRVLVMSGILMLRPASLLALSPRRQPGYPGYRRLESEGLLAKRAEDAHGIFESCKLCPRQCGVNRLKGESGYCQSTAKVRVYSAHPHFGEELSLTGHDGSGTIFFSNCNLRCVFCQNWSIAHLGEGEEIQDEDLADMMIRMQRLGCHNINLVTPTHVMPNIINGTRIACKKGLRIPLVYNTSGYERVEMLKLLDGIVDIYLPDLKYMDGYQAAKYSAGAVDYPEMAQKGILEMHRQVGLHRTDYGGIAIKGLMIRHLVMPNRVAGTEKFVRWVAANLPKSTYVNIMPQYHVAYKAFDYPEISRGIYVGEFLEAMAWAEKYGLSSLDPRSIQSRNRYARQR